jgi:hypothetical protein
MLAGLLLTAGCADMIGPEKFATARVSGRVTLGSSQPVPGRWVEMIPTRGTTGRLASSRTLADGSFTIEDAPVGSVGIRLVGAPIRPAGPSLLDRFLFQVSQTYLIRREIPGQGGELSIDLLREFEQYSQGRN